MITDSEPEHPRRTIRIAILLSLVFHATGAAIYGIVPASKFVLSPHVRPTPEQMVTISDSFRIDHKAVVPRPQHAAQQHTPHRVRPPVPPPVVAAPVPQPVAVPQSVAARALPPVPAPPTARPVPQHVRHELTKDDPHAPHQPPKTVVAQVPLEERTSPPTTPPVSPQPTLPPETSAPQTSPPQTSAPRTAPPETAAPHTAPPETPRPAARPVVRHAIVPPKRVAIAEPLAPHPPARPGHTRLTPQQIASIDSDLAKSIAHDRSEENPLRVPQAPPAAPRRYHMAIDSVHVGQLRAGEGTYWPLDDGRRGADGYTYYHCAYAFQWADGTYEHGEVPWPVRFAPDQDPMLHPELERGGPIGLPPPPPGFVLAAGQYVGHALRGYFPNVVFTQE